MALAVSRPYACPTCRESFTKWGLCQTHIRNSGPCRDALGGTMQDQDALQELCRHAASSAGMQTSSVHLGSAVAPSVTSASHGRSIMPEADYTQHISPILVKKLRKALQHGYLTSPEHAELEDKFEDLSEHSFAMQDAAIDKFLALGLGDLRWVVDKGAWLSRCLKFSARTTSHEPEGDATSPQSMLISALAAHALLPDALAQECWDRFLEFDPEEQRSIITAVRSSLAATVSSKFSDHFSNLCANEVHIFTLVASPPPRKKLTAPMGWEAIEGSLYHRLLQLLLFRQRNSEEQLFKELADAVPAVQPGEVGSLLHTHLATANARQGGSAEVLALLHAGAVSGLSRACARFIAEGLDVNECTGLKMEAPLHVAASHGEVEVVRLLLQYRALPNIRDADGHTPLYVAVDMAVQLAQSDRDSASAAVTNHGLQLKCCEVLLQGGAECFEEGTWNPEALAGHHKLYDIRNLIRLHKRLAMLKHRQIINAEVVAELQKLQYETAIFTIAVFEKHTLRLTSSRTAMAELRALIASEFIQERNRIQILGNRLAKRLGIIKKAIDNLVNLPPEVAMYVLNNFKIEETVPGIFEIPDHLNIDESPSQKCTSSPLPSAHGQSDRIDANDGQANEGVLNASEEKTEESPKLEGRVRKWEPERGFGFIVQDLQPGEQAQKDIFVHRTNLVGSTTSHPINLTEHCRVSYRLGEHDGRLRALDVTMIDAQSRPLPIHSGVWAQADQSKGNNGADGSENEMDEDDVISQKFNRFIRSRAVQDLAKDKRADVEAWLRCVGLRKHNAARRDELTLKKEIDARIDLLVNKQTTPLLQRDFDFRVTRFLYEFCVRSNVTRASELLTLIESSTAGKSRDDVRSWPAYLAALLRKFDPKLYESLSNRDRRSRIELRKQRAEAARSVIKAVDIDASGENIDDAQFINEEQDVHNGTVSDGSNDSPFPEYSPRSSEVASTIHSSESEIVSPREANVVYQAPQPDAPHPSGGPGANLFRYTGASLQPPHDTTIEVQTSATRVFQ